MTGYSDLTRKLIKREGDEVIKNHFLPLLSQEEMEALPFPQYGESELICQAGDGFIPMKVSDYIHNDGLSSTCPSLSHVVHLLPEVIPNTELEKAMRERGVDIEEISASFVSIPPRVNDLKDIREGRIAA